MKLKHLKYTVVVFVILLLLCSCEYKKNNEEETNILSQNAGSTVSSVTDDKISKINLEFESNKSYDKNQEYLVEYIYSNINTAEFYNYCNESIYEAAENGIDLSADSYKITCDEYFGDFDSDGNEEMFAYLSMELFSALPDTYYRELWYTDGKKTEQLTSEVGQLALSGMLNELNGRPLIYVINEIVMGSSIQTAHCYTVSENNAVEYILPNQNQYFAFYFNGENNDRHNIFINSKDTKYADVINAVDNANELNKPIQTFYWVDNTLEITSGFGFNSQPTEDFYINLGCEKGLYYKDICKKYFHTNADINWEYDMEKEQLIDERQGRHFTPLLGIVDGDSYIAMTYDEVEKYFLDMGISNHAFEDFQESAYGAYYNIDGQLYVGTIDGGLWGWDCAFIDSYTLLDEETVQYNCIWIGYAGAYADGYWDYETDKTEPFTFTLKYIDDTWMFYECDNMYAFTDYFVGLEENNIRR